MPWQHQQQHQQLTATTMTLAMATQWDPIKCATKCKMASAVSIATATLTPTATLTSTADCDCSAQTADAVKFNVVNFYGICVPSCRHQVGARWLCGSVARWHGGKLARDAPYLMPHATMQPLVA